MVTCKVDSSVVPKVSRPRKTSSTSSGFRLLDGDQLDNTSSVSRNSIYKIKIDSMFDDNRSIRSSNRFDDRRGSHRTRSIIMYGKSELTGTVTGGDKNSVSNRSLRRRNIIKSNSTASDVVTINGANVKQDGRKISNSVQAQIERMFTDVAKDSTCSFAVRCLGSLPLKDKVTSLQGLQEPLRQLYLTETAPNQINGQLDICATGLRLRQNTDSGPRTTPFHNIAVWSAVKFVVSKEEGGAAFLPLITDPENIDKASLFRPLTAGDQRRLSSGLHAPIFAVVMRSSGLPKLLECHAFVCQTPEEAIVIAATLYQSLMSHVSTNSHRSAKKRAPRNQNGVSCVSIASSSVLTGSNYMVRPTANTNAVGRKNSVRGSNRIRSNGNAINSPNSSARQIRKKRAASSSLSGESDHFHDVIESTTEERKKKSHKTKRAPPIPTPARNKSNSKAITSNQNSAIVAPSNETDAIDSIVDLNSSPSYSSANIDAKNKSGHGSEQLYPRNGEGGDILTRVAIPRSGSFLNTGGLTRYKSRAARRHSGKNNIGGGGGGSPLGFSELFNEFRLHENLHSLDDILSAIIDADGMSFNDLKPIYKEFLLKLAVTLTKDELYQRSKNIMRRQRKKKLKRKNSQKKKNFSIGAGLKNVFRFGKFRSNNKSLKSTNSSNKSNAKTVCNSAKGKENQCCKIGATSSSDLSVARHEHNMIGLHRNSSSGYVSCSECSYDSEACTCESADRCYCSLGADNDQQKSKNSQSPFNEKLRRRSRTPGPRDSLLSCRTEEKCYCSMLDTPGDTSDTTYCDTDSCNSVSKCYCQRSELKPNSRNAPNHNNGSKTESNKSSALSDDPKKQKHHQIKPKNSDKFGLDYELFTINGENVRKSRSRSVNSENHSNSCRSSCHGVQITKQKLKQHEALSVKKSVEAAAVFGDMKLSQTTDIKHFKSSGKHNHIQQQQQQQPPKVNGSIRNVVNSNNDRNNKKNSFSKRREESKSVDRQSSASSGRKLNGNSISSRKISESQRSHQRSSSTDNFMSKLNAIEKYNYRGGKNSIKGGTVGESYYQSMRIVSASLEDSLGYLP